MTLPASFRTLSRKRLAAGLVLLCLLFTLTACREEDFTDTTVKVMVRPSRYDAVFLYHPDTGECEYLVGSADTRVHPASLTKLLTALTAQEILPLDTVITPGEEVYLPGENASSAFIRPHHSLTLEMLIEGMMIPSGDDAAYAAAAACGYALLGDEEASVSEALAAFMEYMNEYARSLGCTGTHFTVPDGYAGEEHDSTAGDMVKICAAAADNEVIARYAAMASDDVIYESGHTNTWVNTNKLLDPDSRYYCESVTGLKTGTLNRRYSLAALYDDGETRLLIGIFGARSDSARYGLVKSVLRTLKLLK